MLRDAKILMAGAALALICAPFSGEEALAQASQLEVKKNKPYTNKPSGITLPYKLTGLERYSASSFDPKDLNIGVQYAPADESEFLTVYIFRNASGNAAVWFDRARVAIETRDIFGRVSPGIPAAAFAPPGQKQTSGLRTVYSLANKDFLSTGLMIFSVGDWYIKIRASSKKRGTKQLNQWMDEVLAGIVWPTEIAESPTASLVEDCASSFKVHDNAKAAPGDPMETALLSGLMGIKLNTKGTDDEAEAVIWCRDKTVTGKYGGIYRADESQNSYLYALKDGGTAISTGLDGLTGLLDEADENGEKPKKYSVSLLLPGRTKHFMPRNKLPSPAILEKVIAGERPVSANVTWSEDGNTTVEITVD